MLFPAERRNGNGRRRPHAPTDWEQDHSSRCFVHLTDSLSWEKITLTPTPTEPPTAATYSEAGLPWFDHYVEAPSIGGSKELRGVKSVTEIDSESGTAPRLKNDSIDIERVIQLRQKLADGQVREGEF